jgi:transcriptional regulator with XRE-family HTH domain
MTSTEPLEELCEGLRAARLKLRMSQTSLVLRTGLSRTTVSQAFSGRSIPSDETVVALAAALGLDPAPLLILRRAAHVQSRPPAAQAQRPGRKVRSQNAGLRQEDSEFETRYREYLKERHGQLQIVGLDLRGPAQACWPLDAAYLSLELAEHDHARYFDGFTPSQPRVERAEQALAGHSRTLIRGLAGSGKTTLLQWLSCATASGDLPKPLEDLRSSIAFLLPLRTFSRRGELPAPQDYLAAVGCPLAATQPDGWADRVLASGRGLVLVDGLDEVPKTLRDKTGHWLKELLSAYSRSRIVVTTRPTAVPESWLQDINFRELTVRPMSRTDVGVFVTRWHTAAKAGAASEELHTRLDALEKTLKDKVRAKRDLALLTTTPLLCALVCALHRDRRGQLPHDRVELYTAALSMFLQRRDQEREIVAPEGIYLSEKESVQLLQKLAYWLIRNGQTELDRSTAEGLLSEALLGMSSVAEQGDAHSILSHLLGRSGLLRDPTEDTIDFVHRTFQDFLGAKAAVEAYDLPFVANQAHDEQWEDVVRMAVAHARPDERAQLLKRILERGDTEPKYSTRLRLLALACLQHATELSPSIRADIQAQADSLLPPRSLEEASALVKVGPVLLDLLPFPDDLEDDEKKAVIQAAQMIGGDAALAYLKNFNNDHTTVVRFALANDWNRFDPREYVEEVLSTSRGPYQIIFIEDPQQAEAIGPLEVTGAFYTGDHAADQLSKQPNAANISFLTLIGNYEIGDLEWTSKYPVLEELRLADCPYISSLEGIRHAVLKSISLDTMDASLDVSVLAEMETIDSLTLDTLLPFRDLSELPAPDGLTHLSLGSGFLEDATLNGLSRWPELRSVTLPADRFSLEFVEILDLPRIRHISLSGDLDADGALQQVPEIRQITSLNVELSGGMFDLSFVARTFPRLKRLSIVASGRGTRIDVSRLSGTLDLESLHITNCAQIDGLGEFPTSAITLTPRPRK